MYKLFANHRPVYIVGVEYRTESKALLKAISKTQIPYTPRTLYNCKHFTPTVLFIAKQDTDLVAVG